MACAVKVLMEMEDVIASMVGKDRFAISVSIIIKYTKSGAVMDMI